VTVVLHWFLPTNGDSRVDLSLGNAVGAHDSRVVEDGRERSPTIGYIGQIARSAEQLGFTAALTPTSSWCEDAWVMTAGLTQVTERFKFLVAFRPGLLSPTLAAQMAATYQRISGGRLLLNVVTGGDDTEQRRFGDHLGKDDRYARAGTGTGTYINVQGAQIVPAAGLARYLPRRLIVGRPRRRRRARRRLPHVGRAARRSGCSRGSIRLLSNGPRRSNTRRSPWVNSG
jgi:hypothetical protein